MRMVRLGTRRFNLADRASWDGALDPMPAVRYDVVQSGCAEEPVAAPGDITEGLLRVAQGEQGASDKLYALLYEELRRVGGSKIIRVGSETSPWLAETGISG